MARSEPKSWDILKKLSPTETAKFRDVYNDQQLERTKIDPKETMTSRTILSVCVSIGVAILTYILLSVVFGVIGGVSSMSGEDAQAPSDGSVQGTQSCIIWQDDRPMFFASGLFSGLSFEDVMEGTGITRDQASKDMGWEAFKGLFGRENGKAVAPSGKEFSAGDLNKLYQKFLRIDWSINDPNSNSGDNQGSQNGNQSGDGSGQGDTWTQPGSENNGGPNGNQSGNNGNSGQNGNQNGGNNNAGQPWSSLPRVDVNTVDRNQGIADFVAMYFWKDMNATPEVWYDADGTPRSREEMQAYYDEVMRQAGTAQSGNQGGQNGSDGDNSGDGQNGQSGDESGNPNLAGLERLDIYTMDTTMEIGTFVGKYLWKDEAADTETWYDANGVALNRDQVQAYYTASMAAAKSAQNLDGAAGGGQAGTDSDYDYASLPEIDISTIDPNISKADFAGTYFYRDSNGAYHDCKNVIRDGSAMGQYYAEVKAAAAAAQGVASSGSDSALDGAEKAAKGMFAPSLLKLFISLAAGLITFAMMYTMMKKNLDAQNLLNDTADINQYQNDQHIALPEEIQKKFDWFPDAGAHCSVLVSSMISHMMLSNKGLNRVKLAKRADKDILDEDGDILYYKGEILTDDDGEPIFDLVPMIDEKFGDALFDASGLPDVKEMRKKYDTTQIPYNPGNKNRDKLKDCETVADMINKDWIFPPYEPQRPAGAYIVDTDPVNTMVLAITRAGKGQTVIEPTIDMWTRERQPNNAIINDPKGELLVKFYVKGTTRGFQIVQFNLINAMKTDIYNPMGLAAEAAREGDFTKCAMYVENIADVFFPVDGGDDPVWPNAANNAFKRAAYGLIDYYLEEEKALRLLAERTNMDEKVLDTKLDIMWGKVTLYNCYQLFVQLTAKKEPNPSVEFTKKAKNGDFDMPSEENPTGGKEPLTDDEYNARLADVERDSVLWEGQPEKDLLTLFFNATSELPANSMRTLINNANNALRAMAGAEKMLASVYGIAITAMSFFTDPTISTLTSGTPSQNVDLGGLSFPRRMGVRLNVDFIKRYHLIGMQAKWQCFADKDFKESLGKDFYHEDLVTREGWALCYFKGKFPKDVAYLRLQIVNPQTNQLIRSLYFRFQKSYMTSLDARYYVMDPVLGKKIVKNGILTELRPYKKKDGQPGEVVYRKAKLTFKQRKIRDVLAGGKVEDIDVPAVTRTMVRYSEQAKLVFLVTPPHLMKYAKLILILVKQLVDLNFDKSYMTKSNQKPLYKTRFMLDELGNLQSEGHGISNFQTMLSIGLGQEQQFTLILQTLQQLRDVYGDSVDKIVQGNTSNIVFLKSTDDSMIDTLQKMSGTRHVARKTSKTVTKDMEKILLQNEGKVSYTMSVSEEPVIQYNDMAFIAERNSMIFRAGDSPIWNRNETILPMSWRLFANTIIQPGKEYTLQTIPTLSSALDFDVRKNQPDFMAMWAVRREQAKYAVQAKEIYQKAYGYTDQEIAQLDPDIYADELMEIINNLIVANKRAEAESDDDEIPDDMINMYDQIDYSDMVFTENTEVLEETSKAQARHEENNGARYAGNMLSRNDIWAHGTGAKHHLDSDIIAVYKELDGAMKQDKANFTFRDGALCGLNGEVYIRIIDRQRELDAANEAAKDDDSRVFSEGDIEQQELTDVNRYEVTDAFYQFLVSLDDWKGIANGRFESEMAKRCAVG